MSQFETCTVLSLPRSGRMAPFKPRNKTIPGTSQPHFGLQLLVTLLL